MGADATNRGRERGPHYTGKNNGSPPAESVPPSDSEIELARDVVAVSDMVRGDLRRYLTPQLYLRLSPQFLQDGIEALTGPAQGVTHPGDERPVLATVDTLICRPKLLMQCLGRG